MGILLTTLVIEIAIIATRGHRHVSDIENALYFAIDRPSIISRLGRSTRDLLNIIDVLQRKKVTLVSSKENIDTNTPQGRFVLSIFAALSELEREQTLQRQREGIAIAKTQGKYKGRQPIHIDWEKFGQLYEQWESGNITAVDFQKQMGLQANTFYRRIREYEERYI